MTPGSDIAAEVRRVLRPLTPDNALYMARHGGLGPWLDRIKADLCTLLADPRLSQLGVPAGQAEALAKEVVGMGAFEAEIRSIIGNSNWIVLQKRAEELRDTLSASSPPPVVPPWGGVERVIANVEEMLPGRGWILTKGRLSPSEPLYAASVCPIDDPENPLAEAESDTLRVALETALVNALAVSPPSPQPPAGERECPTCEGTGTFRFYEADADGMRPAEVPCRNCNGTGRLPGHSAAGAEREAFEKWQRSRYVTAFQRNPIGAWGDERGDNYVAPFVQASWEAWQARAALAQPPSEEEVERGAQAGYDAYCSADRQIKLRLSQGERAAWRDIARAVLAARGGQ